MGDQRLPLRFPGALVVPHHYRNVPSRAELELLRSLRILGPQQARAAGERRPVGADVGESARHVVAEALDYSRNFRARAHWRISRSSACDGGRTIPPFLQE